MTKSYESNLTRVVSCILADAKRYFPEHQVEFQRDFSRLISLVESRGLGLFTLDLPNLGKHFDLCLSRCLYTRPSLPLSRRRKPGSVIPRLFQGLLLEVFNDNGELLKDPDKQAIFLLRQLYYFAKKFKIDCPKSALYETVSEFYQIEAELPNPTLDWESDSLDERNLDSLSFYNYVPHTEQDGWMPPKPLLQYLQETADIVASFIGEFDPMKCDPKHGPGVVSDLKKEDFKYRFPQWNQKLEGVFPYADLAYANYRLWLDDVQDLNCADDSVEFSKLIAVPKTQKGPRLIAAEPTAYQYCQQAIWIFLKERVNVTFLNGFIRFSDQSFNQDAALFASRSGDFATLDLSSASDRLTCRFVERMFRANPSFLRALHASRTRYLVQEIDKKSPGVVTLKKFSTQGSACTFPVESICFLTVCLAATLYERGYKPSVKNIRSLIGEVRVFGDDLIVPKDSEKCIRSLLGYLSFKVNESKSFGTGNFRESCGLDAYDGEDVTPAYYVRDLNPRKPETIVSTVEVSNNFFMKGLWTTAKSIQETVKLRHLAVVSVSSGLFGLKSFCGYHFTKVKWNNSYQKIDLLCPILKSGKTRESVGHYGALLQYFQEKPRPDIVWTSGKTLRPKLKIVLGRATLAD